MPWVKQTLHWYHGKPPCMWMKPTFLFAFSSKVMDVNHGCPTRKRRIIGTGSFLLSPVGTWCFGGFCMWMKPTFLSTLFFTGYGCWIMDDVHWGRDPTSLRQLGAHHSWLWALIIHPSVWGFWLDMLFYMPKIIQWMGAYAYLACNNFQCWYYDWQMKNK